MLVPRPTRPLRSPASPRRPFAPHGNVVSSLRTALAASIVAAFAAAFSPAHLAAQDAVIIRGGWIFTGTTDTVERNRGILVRGGKLLVTDGKMSEDDTSNAKVIRLRDDEYILPGFFDLHAHYNMTLGEGGVRND